MGYQLQIRQGQHTLIAGRNGTGKTTLLLRLMSTRRHPIILDSKHELKRKGFIVTSSISVALSKCPAIFRPHDGKRGEIDIRLLCAAIYAAGGYDLAVDEIYALGGKNFSSYPEELIRLYTRGRSRGISVTACTQRPVFCPRFCFTEPYHIFVFALDEADAVHLAKSVGNRQLATPQQGHSFLYYNKSDGTIVQHTLPKREAA